jgi:hypothetical protein
MRTDRLAALLACLSFAQVACNGPRKAPRDAASRTASTASMDAALDGARTNQPVSDASGRAPADAGAPSRPSMDAATTPASDANTSSTSPMDATMIADATSPMPTPDAGDARADATSNATDASGPESELMPDPNPCGMRSGDPAVLVDVGQTGFGSPYWSGIRRSGDRLFAYTDKRQVVLWDLTTRTQFLHVDVTTSSNGVDSPFADLRGPTLVVEKTPGNLEVYSSSTGTLLTTIATGTPTNTNTQFGLATDGSYIWSQALTGLSAWTPTGTPLVMQPGDYSHAIVFAAPVELRVAKGPAGSDVIELVDTNHATSTVTQTFLGQFSRWFVDGGRFFTLAGSTLRVYPKHADSVAPVFSVSAFSDGQGDFFWDSPALNLGPINVYSVAGGSTPIFTTGGGSTAFPLSTAKSMLAFLSPSRLDVVRLDQTPAQTTSYTLSQVANTFAGNDDDDARWIAGSGGLLYTSEDIVRGTLDAPLGCGGVADIIGSTTGYVAIASQRGILIAQVTAQSKRIIGRIPFTTGSVQMSADGTFLAAGISGSLRIWRLPDGVRVADWPYTNATQGSFSLATAAPVVLRRDQDGYLVNDFSGNVQYSVPEPAYLAPAGVLSADLHGRTYRSGTLVGGVSGEILGWFDDDRVLVQTWHYGTAASPRYDRSEIRDVTGQLLGTPSLPEIRIATTARPFDATAQYIVPEFQPVSANAIYVRSMNSVFDLNASATTVLWSRPTIGSPRGTLAGTFAVWLSSNAHEIRAETF